MINTSFVQRSVAKNTPPSTGECLSHEEMLLALERIMDNTDIAPTGALRVHIEANDLAYEAVVDFLLAFASDHEASDELLSPVVVLSVNFDSKSININDIAQTLNTLHLTDHFAIEPLNLSVLASGDQEMVLEQIA